MSTLPTNALCTRKEVKDYLAITGDDNTLDNLINDLIGRISTAFENFCGRPFVSASYTDYYDGDGSNMLFVDKYPLTAITSIHDDTDWVWGSDKLLAASEYRIADERYVILDGTFGIGNQNIKIVYTGGYSTIPTDLKHACIEETGRKIKHRTDYDELTKQLTDGSVQYADKDFLPQTVKTLSFYKVKMVL
jgi:hypothetical protein